MRGAWGAAVAVSALLALPAAASATTVTWSQTCPPKGGDCFAAIAVVAAPGEANRMLVSTAPGGGVQVRELAAPLSAAGGCTLTDPTTATCLAGRITITLGDKDDALAVDFGAAALSAALPRGIDAGSATPGVTADGGEGNDALAGGAGPDALIGGPGLDALAGGDGDDDLLDGGPAGESDAYDGGPGVDRVSYAGRATPVTVDLTQPASAGAPGEDDRLHALEDAGGGDGADVLSGDDGPNALSGSDGDDVLRGRGGADTVSGDAGHNRVDAGPDDDQVDTDFGADDVVCGTGFDHVEDARADDRVRTDCERVRFAVAFDQTVALAPLRSARSTVARLNRFACEETPCRLTLTLRSAGGRTLGRAVQRIPSNRTRGGLSVRLNAAGRAALHRHARLSVVVAFAVYGDTSAVTVLLDRP